LADFSIPITVPDDKVADLIDALNAEWGPPGGPAMTPAQLRAELKRLTEANLRRIYRNHKRRQAKQAYDQDLATLPDLDVT